MSKICKCGHPERTHGCYEDNCQCAKFAPPTPPGEWLDAPDGDGWWWLTNSEDPGKVFAVDVAGIRATLNADKGSYALCTFKNAKWQRAQVPTPPPPPLPRERSVTLSGRVHYQGRRGYEAQLIVDGRELDWSDHMTKEASIDHVRSYGIEPEVSE